MRHPLAAVEFVTKVISKSLDAIRFAGKSVLNHRGNGGNEDFGVVRIAK